MSTPAGWAVTVPARRRRRRGQAEADAGENLSALSDRWLSHWDRHAAVCCSSRGPFHNCDPTLGHLHQVDGGQEQVVPVEMPPDEWRPHT